MPVGLSRPRIRLVCSQHAGQVLRRQTKQLTGWLNNRLAHVYDILTPKEAASLDLECQLSIFVFDRERVDLTCQVIDCAYKGLQVWVFAKKDLDFLDEFKRDFGPLNTRPIVTTWVSLVDDGCTQIPEFLSGFFHPELFLPPPVLPVPTVEGLFA